MTREQLAKKLAKEAGEYLLNNFYTFKPKEKSYKANKTTVTKYDKGAEKIILKAIKKYFPNDAILSEEAGANNKESEYLWIVDPLDGTRNFTMRNPVFSVAIAIIYLPDKNSSKAEVKHGFVYVPVLKDMYEASLHKGTKLNGKKVYVSKIAKMEDAQHTFCHGQGPTYMSKSGRYNLNLKKKNIDARQLGSAAIELALVSSGRSESIVIPGANSWDVAAGILLVREAGGKVTDANGGAWRLGSTDMIATNGKVHNKILKVFNNA
ncbi:MAG: inositol monophosphatase family protein [Candidatus Komeilibacteria bacterium]